MGYKVVNEGLDDVMADGFYLNHMGYKASMRILAGTSRAPFYLNHMGYKVFTIVQKAVATSSFI